MHTPAAHPHEHDHLALLHLLDAGGAAEPRRRLLAAWDSPAAALDAGPGAWRAAGLDQAQAAQLARRPQIDAQTRQWLAGPGHRLIGWSDPDYPPLLRATASPPLALFVAGDADLLWHPAIAIVGSRAATAQGRDNAAAFARALAAAGFATCSGMALGIDTSAHLATVDAGGATIAVLGCGVDQPYPRSNSRLHGRIVAGGAVVSEHPPGTVARREHFPSRNRIIAGLSLGTLVVEAATRSGALITARLAAEAGREVFALPGSIHNPMARGCHRLIRDGAALVETPGELVEALQPVAMELGQALRRRLDGPPSAAGVPAPAPVATDRFDTPDYQNLWQALGHDPTPMDLLVERTGLTPAVLSSMLLPMELDGRVSKEHGRYARKS